MPTEADVRTAVRAAPKADLELLLATLWTHDSKARKYIEAKLLVGNRTTITGVAAGNNENSRAMAYCMSCHKSFDPARIDALVCRRSHTGHKEVDNESDVWADHDDRCHGDPDSSTLKDDSTYDEGYIWSCCEASGGAPGCKAYRHLAEAEDGPKKAKKRARGVEYVTIDD